MSSRRRRPSSRSSSDAAAAAPHTPESRFSRSPFSSSYASTASTSSAASRGSMKSAARSFVGVFVSCFTPPHHEPPDPPSSASAGTQRSSGSGGNGVRGRGSGVSKEGGNVRFTMAEIYNATSGFCPALKIGQGGFGIVYKGTLKDGTIVAVKRAKKSMHDTHTGKEFQSEVQILAQVEHLNLVKFHGYLEEEDERILVVEYVPNGTLKEHLDGIHGDVLDMAARLDIAIDVAHAITYLHMYSDHPIIHRDIKSSNILLTETRRAKVADFGFARLGADAESGATHVSTQVKGTAGYLDPEYLRTYQLTDKSDVYSFGILLIEVVTGRRPVNMKREPFERITSKWVMKKYMSGDAISAMDPKLESNAANKLALEKILELAFECIAPQRQSRPSMRRCAEILWGIRKEYKELLASELQSIHSHSETNHSIVDEDYDEEQSPCSLAQYGSDGGDIIEESNSLDLGLVSQG
ncbi:hypothetical protein Droror1_Dr00004890 [Drosera rotundifolia]